MCRNPVSSIIIALSQNSLIRYLKLKHLAVKLFTVAMVVYYYDRYCGVPFEQRLTQNDATLINFIGFFHILAILPLKYNGHGGFCRNIPTFITGFILFILGMVVLIWPWLAWYNYEITQVDTDYWSVRFVVYFMYIIVTNAARFDSLDAVQMLIGEGFLLSHIAQMLMYNNLDSGLTLFCLVPWLLIQNAQLAIDCVTYDPKNKHNFARLIGPHQSIFFMLINSGVIVLNALMNVYVFGWENICMIVLIPYTLFVMDRLMDNKKDVLLKSPLAALIAVATVLLICAHFYSQFATREVAALRTEPLFKRKVVTVEEVIVEESSDDWWWYRIKFDGIRFYYDYVLLPLYNWVLYPLWSMITSFFNSNDPKTSLAEALDPTDAISDEI